MGLPVLVLLFSIVSSAAPPDETQQAANGLATSVMTGPAMSTLRELTDGFGGRLTGSPAYEHSAEWAAAKFRSYGIKDVKLEGFTIPSGWQRGTASAEMLMPLQRPLHVESLGWAPSTPAGGVESEVVAMSDFSEANVKASADKVKGRIVMIDAPKSVTRQDRAKLARMTRAAYPLLHDEGALAVLLPGREPNNIINAHSSDWHANLAALPLVDLGMEDADLIRRALAAPNGRVRIKLDVQNQVSGPTTAHNVIAEIRGSEQPDDWVLIGGHLDSWDFGTGAQDNGTGTVSVLEVARVFAIMGRAPRRTIRFALWGGEEEGIIGSRAYTEAHLAELEKCVAVINTDNGAGHPKGWKVEGRKDLLAAMQPISDSLLKGMGAADLSLETTYDTDHGPFMLHGIPALDQEVDMSHYMEVHHKPSDTYDKVDPVDFKVDVAIVAVTAYAIVQDPKAIAPHIDHAAVGEIVKTAGLEDMLKDAGLWQ
jgi:Iap family predicted aminopeptidase